MLPLETIMTLLIGYTLIRTVKFFFFLKKRKTRINSIIKNTGELFYIKRPKKYDSQRQRGNFDWELRLRKRKKLGQIHNVVRDRKSRPS